MMFNTSKVTCLALACILPLIISTESAWALDPSCVGVFQSVEPYKVRTAEGQEVKIENTADQIVEQSLFILRTYRKHTHEGKTLSYELAELPRDKDMEIALNRKETNPIAHDLAVELHKFYEGQPSDQMNYPRARVEAYRRLAAQIQHSSYQTKPIATLENNSITNASYADYLVEQALFLLGRFSDKSNSGKTLNQVAIELTETVHMRQRFSSNYFDSKSINLARTVANNFMLPEDQLLASRAFRQKNIVEMNRVRTALYREFLKNTQVP